MDCCFCSARLISVLPFPGQVSPSRYSAKAISVQEAGGFLSANPGLTLLDLSAAVDIDDHFLLLETLSALAFRYCALLVFLLSLLGLLCWLFHTSLNSRR